MENLDTFLGGAAPLSALTRERAADGQMSLPAEQQAEAHALICDLNASLRDWNWQA